MIQDNVYYLMKSLIYNLVGANLRKFIDSNKKEN